MISDISYCRVPTDLSVVHIPCYFCLGQLPKSLWAWSSFLLLFQKKLQSMKEEYEAMGFPWFSIVFPLRLSISVALLLGSRPGSKKRRKTLRRMGFYLQRCLLQVLNETCASECTSQLLHDSCATHWKPIPRNKLEAWQQCKRRAVWLSDCHCKPIAWCSWSRVWFRFWHEWFRVLWRNWRRRKAKPMMLRCSQPIYRLSWFHMISDNSYFRSTTIWVYCAHYMFCLQNVLGREVVAFSVSEEAPINERSIRGHGFSMISTVVPLRFLQV